MSTHAAPEFTYGPIDVYVVEFEGERLAPGVLDALLDLSASGAVRVVDLVAATRDHSGSVHVIELREDAPQTSSAIEFDLEIEGLIGDDDITEAVANVPPGFGVAIAAIELRWATTLASRLAAASGRVIRTERISAPLVNELVAMAITPENEGA